MDEWGHNPHGCWRRPLLIVLGTAALVAVLVLVAFLVRL